MGGKGAEKGDATQKEDDEPKGDIGCSDFFLIFSEK
jgi:hypothetical protein